MSQVTYAEKKTNKKWLPVLGFLMLVALAVLSYFLAPVAIDFAVDNIRGFNRTILPPVQLRLAFAAVMFVVLASIGAIIVAIATPKRQVNVRESDLVKERDAAAKARVAAKKRQRRINREMRSGR